MHDEKNPPPLRSCRDDLLFYSGPGGLNYGKCGSPKLPNSDSRNPMDHKKN